MVKREGLILLQRLHSGRSLALYKFDDTSVGRLIASHFNMRWSIENLREDNILPYEHDMNFNLIII